VTAAASVTAPVAPVAWRSRATTAALLALLTYLPALTAAPGRMPSDTKLYLYLDPGRLIADAPFSWDTRQFAGWVPHQTIAYLWPSGPWYWVFDRLGVPDWIAHRLWIGTILFLGGLGVAWAARHLGLSRTAATVAGVVFATSPYVLPYISRTSSMLLTWASVGWMLGLTIRAATRTRWRDAALFSLVVLTVGAVNATALLLVAPVPVLWLAHAAWGRIITWRTAVATALRIGILTVAVSLWWMAMLVVQGRHGADVLAFSETLDAVSLTSTGGETLRGLGYWLFYVRDPYAFTTTASLHHMASVPVILLGYALVVLGLAGLAITRWLHRRFAVLLVGCGIVLAVGVHPIDDPSPLMSPFVDSALALALRSSTRALPMSTFGVALGAGALVAALERWAAGRARPSGRVAHRIAHRVGAIAAAFVVMVAVLGSPSLRNGGYVDPALERDQDPPAAWTDAAASLDQGSTEHRVLQVPGSEFGAFRWGYTVDPPLPGLTDKPLVTRDLLPLGSPGAMDLLYAFDNRLQEGVLDPAALAPVARLLGADTIWVSNDLAFERFRTPRPESVDTLVRTAVGAGVSSPFEVGEPTPNTPGLAMVDEQSLSDAHVGQPIAPVLLAAVDDPVSIVRAGAGVVLVAGSGDGLVDAAAAGLLTGDEIVVMFADLQPATEAGWTPDERTPLILTDSNRDRAMQWRGSQDTTGFTETGGPDADRTVDDTSDQRLVDFLDPVWSNADQQTVAMLRRADGSPLDVRASGYGEPFAFRPEDRPALAVDGDPATAWRVSDRSDPIDQSITVTSPGPELRLLQQQLPGATRTITAVTLTEQVGDAAPTVRTIALDDTSRVGGQTIELANGGLPDAVVTITISGVADVAGTDTGPSAVGIAELGPVATEVVRPPAAGFEQAIDGRPLAVVLTRERTRSTNRWRADPETALQRTIDLPTARSVAVRATLRIDRTAPDDALSALLDTGRPWVTSNRRLHGVVEARATSAFDGDPTTAWTTPFGGLDGGPVGAAITAVVDPSTPITSFRIRTVGDDGAHSPITAISVVDEASGRGHVGILLPPTAADGWITVELPNPVQPNVGSDGLARVRLAIDAIDERTTVDRRYAERTTLPSAIVEIDGFATVDRPAGTSTTGCRTDLLSIDGVGIPLRVTSLPDPAAAELGDAGVDVVGCDTTIDLAAGPVLLASAPGARTGLDVDRVVLTSGWAPPAASPVATSVTRTRTTRTVRVDACPSGCWLVLGEGHNPAWSADVGGTDLGSPTQVSGGFNGWWLPPSTAEREVTMRWTPQTGLNRALGVAMLGIVVSIVLAIADRRRRPPEILLAVAEPPVLAWAPQVERREAAIAAATLVVLATLVIEPMWGLVALPVAASVVLTRRPRLAAAAAAVTAGMVGFLVAVRQYFDRFPPDAAWPGRFSDLHAPALFVTVLLLSSLVGERRSRATNHTAEAITTEGSSDDRIR
jgi:arabinofuranan 3-O-arabinosyltransferase